MDTNELGQLVIKNEDGTEVPVVKSEEGEMQVKVGGEIVPINQYQSIDLGDSMNKTQARLVIVSNDRGEKSVHHPDGSVSPVVIRPDGQLMV